MNILVILEYLLSMKMCICKRLTDTCPPKCMYVFNDNYIKPKSCHTSQRVIISVIANRYWNRFTISQLLSEFVQVQYKSYKILYL